MIMNKRCTVKTFQGNVYYKMCSWKANSKYCKGVLSSKFQVGSLLVKYVAVKIAYPQMYL